MKLWSNENWFVMTPKCTGITISQSFVLGVLSEHQKIYVPQWVDIEGNLIIIKCRFGPQRMSLDVINRNWTQLSLGYTYTLQTWITGSYINSQTMMGESGSYSQEKIECLKKIPPKTTYPPWLIILVVQKWINNYFYVWKI